METQTLYKIDAPTIPGSVLAVSFGLLAVFGLTDSLPERVGLIVQLFGFSALALGYAANKRGSSFAALPLYVLGASLVVYSLLHVLTQAPGGGERLVIFLGMLGLASLVCGLIPVRRSLARGLTVAGTALMFFAVVVSGVLELATLPVLLLTGTATIIAWDLADHSITMGSQVGRRGSTARASVVHAGGTVAVATGLVGLILLFARVQFGALPLFGLLALLVAGFALVIALRH